MATTVRKIISSPKIYRPPLPFSPGVLVGSTLYISGAVGWDINGKLVDGIEAQTRLALENIRHILQAVGADYSNVVKVTVLLADLANDGPKMNAVYSSVFNKHQPARAAYQVSKLPAQALVEIEAVAVVGEILEAKL